MNINSFQTPTGLPVSSWGSNPFAGRLLLGAGWLGRLEPGRGRWRVTACSCGRAFRKGSWDGAGCPELDAHVERLHVCTCCRSMKENAKKATLMLSHWFLVRVRHTCNMDSGTDTDSGRCWSLRTMALRCDCDSLWPEKHSCRSSSPC